MSSQVIVDLVTNLGFSGVLIVAGLYVLFRGELEFRYPARRDQAPKNLETGLDD